MNEAKLVAGERGLSNKVSEVIIMEAHDDIENWLKPKQLVLTSLFSLQDSNEKECINLVRAMFELEISGHIVKLGRFVLEALKSLINANVSIVSKDREVIKSTIKSKSEVEIIDSRQLFNESYMTYEYTRELIKDEGDLSSQLLAKINLENNTLVYLVVKEVEKFVLKHDLVDQVLNGKYQGQEELLDLVHSLQLSNDKSYRVNTWMHRPDLTRIKTNLFNIQYFHTDRGNEFKNELIDKVLNTFKIKRSLSKKGTPYDNAVAEATFKSIKTEFIYANKFKTLEELEFKFSAYVWWFNNKRLHSILGYLPPVEYKYQTIYNKCLPEC